MYKTMKLFYLKFNLTLNYRKLDTKTLKIKFFSPSMHFLFNLYFFVVSLKLLMHLWAFWGWGLIFVGGGVNCQPFKHNTTPLPAPLPYDFALGEEVDATCDGEGWLNLSRVAPNLLLLLLEEDNDASPGLIISAALSELLFIRTTSRPPPAPPMTPDEAVACCWALRARRLARMACSSDIVYLYCDLKMVHRWHGQRKTDRCVVSCFQLWHRLAPYRTEHENGRREDAANVVLALRLSLPSCIGPCRDVVVLYGKGGNGGGGIQFGDNVGYNWHCGVSGWSDNIVHP